MNVKRIQIIWTIFVSQATSFAAAKFVSEYNVQEAAVANSKYDHLNKFPFDSQSYPSSHVHPSHQESGSAETHYGRNFGFMPLPTKKRRGAAPERLSLFAKVDRHKYFTPASLNTEKSPNKNSLDLIHSSNVIYQHPSYKPPSKINLHSSADESYRQQPTYKEDPSYEGSPSSYSPYSKSNSYKSYSSVPTEPYLPPGFDPSDYTFPPYPPLPSLDQPPNSPHSEYEARKLGSYRDIPPFPYEDPEPYLVSKDDEVAYNRDDEDEELDIEYAPHPPRIRPQHKNKKYFNGYRAPRPEHKSHRSRNKGERIGKPYGRPAPVSIPHPRSQQDDEEQEDEKEENPDTLLKDSGPEEEEEEGEEIPLAGLEEKLQRRQKDHGSGRNRRRCVKKRRELGIDEANDKPGRQMLCLVCENLETGGTYESCRYESAPKKRKYYAREEEGGASEERQVQRGTRVRRYSSDDDFDSESERLDDEEDFPTDGSPSMPAYDNRDSCVQVKKNGAACLVCHNPETNAEYKQCSYANDPNPDLYKYSQSSRHGAGGKKAFPRGYRYKRELVSSAGDPTPDSARFSNSTGQIRTKLTVPQSWQKLRDIEQRKIQSINKIFKAMARSKRHQPTLQLFTDLEDSSYEKHFLDMFPELNSEQDLLPKRRSLRPRSSLLAEGETEGLGLLKNSKLGGKLEGGKSLLGEGVEEEEEGGVTKLMRDFANKDRSACAKKIKDKMTCYICKDSDGMKREECMYVVENEPKKVAYEESTRTADPQGNKNLKREIPDDVSVYSNTPETRFYTMSAHSPQTYSNVEITYTRHNVPTTTIFKRYAKFSDSVANDSDDETT